MVWVYPYLEKNSKYRIFRDTEDRVTRSGIIKVRFIEVRVNGVYYSVAGNYVVKINFDVIKTKVYNNIKLIVTVGPN